MAKALMTIIALTCALSLAVESFGAEAVKIAYRATIYSDAQGNGLKLPEGVACTESGTVIVADTGNGRLLKYAIGDDNKPTGGEEMKVAEASFPLRLQVNSKGEILVLDGKKRRIVRLGPEGGFRGYVDPTGVPDPAGVVPRSFKIDRDDGIYVLDIFSGSVLVLDAAGAYVRQVPFPEKYGFFSDLAVDPRGTIYLLDSADSNVFVATRDAKEFSPLSKGLEGFVNFPASMAVDKRGVMYVADQNGSGLVILGPDGSFQGRPIVFGWKDGLVRYPAQVSLTEKGDLCIADRENSRVQVFSTQ
jgi:DNA-binding beta-propeller fold protein YncE